MSGYNSQQGNSSDALLGGLAEVLEAVLDKGAVIGGDIKVDKNDAESFPIKLRLIATSVGEAEEIGMDWWANDPFLSSKAAEKKQSKFKEENANQEPQNTNASGSNISEKDLGYASENMNKDTNNENEEKIERNSSEHEKIKEENEILETRLQTLEEKMDKIIEMYASGKVEKEGQTVTTEEKNEQEEKSPKNTKKKNKGKTSVKNQEIQ